MHSGHSYTFTFASMTLLAAFGVACGSSRHHDEPGMAGTGGNATAGSSGAGGAAGRSPVNAGGASAGSAGSAGSPSGGGESGGAGASGAGSPAVRCEDPVDLGFGWEACSNVKIHRAVPVQCSYQPRPRVLKPVLPGNECLQDSDCKEKPNGYCEFPPGFSETGYRCVYGCIADMDCGPSAICVCAQGHPSTDFTAPTWSPAPAGVCYPTDGCKSDADCSDGQLCTPYDTSTGCYANLRFACETAQDSCGGPNDCPDGSFLQGQYCEFDGTKRSCAERNCVVE